MRRRVVYIISTIICFIFCVLIVVLLSNNKLVRGFVGDIVVIILIYSFIKIFIDIRPFKLCIFILLFSYTVEFFQYFGIVDYIGLGESKIARVVIGTVFDFKDLLAYLIGVIVTLLLEEVLFQRLKKAKQ